jgi:hypothetical protein
VDRLDVRYGVTSLPVSIRPAVESDRLFILNSFVKSFGDSHFAQSLPKSFYREGHSRLVEALYPRCRALIACDPSDPDTILGWALTEGNVIQFCYVRASVRRRGIATALLKPYLDKPAFYTHPCPHIKLPAKWSWNPYLLHQGHHATQAA